MCSICLEDNNQKYIHTKGYTFTQGEECYSIRCECNIYIHEECLKKCIEKRKACPICVRPLRNNTDELKEFYFIEIFIMFVLVQLNCIMFHSHPYKIILYFYLILMGLLFIIVQL